ncbi:MAG: hypothetical protein P4M11_15200 [Candidatus Pacebacteria bacterium]|nr:hypothetical protein [Candidatus Paceibacterota bacterium]
MSGAEPRSSGIRGRWVDEANNRFTIDEEEEEELNADFCSDCYNVRLSELRRAKSAAKKAQRREFSRTYNEQIQQEDAEGRLQLAELRKYNRDLLTDPRVKTPGRYSVAGKVTDPSPSKEINIYNYVGYGTDHCREVEERKEKTRERMRETVKQQIFQEEFKNAGKEKMENSAGPGHLDLPSYKPKPDRREQYKRWLLDQIELNRARRRQRREQDRALGKQTIKDFLSTDYFKNPEKSFALKQDYYESLKKFEFDRIMEQKARETDKKQMESVVSEYRTKMTKANEQKRVCYFAQETEIGHSAQTVFGSGVAGAGVQPAETAGEGRAAAMDGAIEHQEVTAAAAARGWERGADRTGEADQRDLNAKRFGRPGLPWHRHHNRPGPSLCRLFQEILIHFQYVIIMHLLLCCCCGRCLRRCVLAAIVKRGNHLISVNELRGRNHELDPYPARCLLIPVICDNSLKHDTSEYVTPPT